MVERGDEYVAAGRHDAAVIEYRNAIRWDARFGEAHYKLAEVYAADGDTRQAYREFMRAADLLAGNTDAQLTAATYLLRAGEFEDAKTRAQLVLDTQPNSVEALILHGSALAGLKDFDGAVTQIEQAVKSDPGRGLTYASLNAIRKFGVHVVRRS